MSLKVRRDEVGTRRINGARVDVSIRCLLKRVGSSGVISGTIVNISQSGLRVECEGLLLEWLEDDEVRFSVSEEHHVFGNHFYGAGRLRWKQAHSVRSGFSVAGFALTDPREIPDKIWRRFAEDRTTVQSL